MKAAIQSIRQQVPGFIIAAVPVADKNIIHSMMSMVDAFVCPNRVDELHAVGSWYEDFAQTEDEEVHELLIRAQKQ
jgi:predicted phosphoribosyltransferase